MKTEITPDQSKRARRELSQSQQQVAKALGISRAKISWLESGKFLPEAEFMEKLRDYFESQGVELDDEDDADADDEPADDADADEDEDEDDDDAKAKGKHRKPSKQPKHGKPSKQPKQHQSKVQKIRISSDLTDEQVGAIMDAIDVQDDHIATLLSDKVQVTDEDEDVLPSIFKHRRNRRQPNQSELSEGDKQRRDNLMKRLATSAMLMRMLQGKPVVPMADDEQMDGEAEVQTIGELVSPDITDMAKEKMTKRQWRKIEDAADADHEDDQELAGA